MYKHRYPQSPQRPSTIRYTGNPSSATPSPESHHNSPTESADGGDLITGNSGDLSIGSNGAVSDGPFQSNHVPRHRVEESSREGFSLTNSLGLCQELKNRWEKAGTGGRTTGGGGGGDLSGNSLSGGGGRATSGGGGGGDLSGSSLSGGGLPGGFHIESRFNGFRGSAGIKQETHDVTKVTGGLRSSTRWAATASFHRRTASDAELDGTTSTTQLGDEDGSNSSAQGSFRGEDVGSEEMSRKRRCLVCEDSASGYHYGVSSCEACKAFFKRTIQGNIEYACPAINACPIDKRRRKACQACRYKKCLSVGMLKEGVRLDRVRGGRQKYRRANNGESIMVQTSLSHVSTGRKSSMTGVHELLTALLACEPDSGLASVTERLDTCVKLQSTLCDLADRDLVGIIGWAKQIPGFPELPLNDQMHLLQSTWCEILFFSLCFRSIDAPQRGILLFTEDFPVNENMAQEAGFDVVHAKACRLVDALKAYRIAREEYVLIKCIILLNGGCVLESTRARDALRDTIVQSLHQFVEGAPRSSNLLLLLPHLRQLDGLAKQFWFMIKNEGKISMHKLFLEMLESAQQLT